MKIKQSSTSTKQKASKTKKSRSRTKAKKSADTLKQPNSELLGGKHNLRKRSVRSPFVNVQQRDLASDLASRINLRARTNSTAVGIGVGGAGGNRTRSKSKVKLDESQSPSSNDPIASQRSLRKRKLYTDDTRVSSLRKSPRLSKDCSKAAMTSKHTISGTGIRSHSYARLARRPSPIMQQKRPWSQFSPPLTRSRLKQLSEQKLAENTVP